MNSIPEARVSVVVPVYNAETFLEKTLRSVFQQTFRDFVVLAVNDGSTDATPDVLNRMQDQRLFVYDQRNSGGPACPRNVGISLTSGEYVALFDSDDLMKPDKLSWSVRVLDDCRNAGFVFSDFEVIDENGSLLTESYLSSYTGFCDLVRTCPSKDTYVFIPPESLFSGLCKWNFVGTSSVVIRRSVLETIGRFDENLRNSDDRDMWFRLARVCGAAYIPKALHSYRKRLGGISSRGSLANAKSRLDVLQRQLEIGVTGDQRRDLLMWIASNHVATGYAERERGHRWASVRAFLTAYTLTPRFRLLLAAAKSAVYFHA